MSLGGLGRWALFVAVGFTPSGGVSLEHFSKSDLLASIKDATDQMRTQLKNTEVWPDPCYPGPCPGFTLPPASSYAGSQVSNTPPDQLVPLPQPQSILPSLQQTTFPAAPLPEVIGKYLYMRREEAPGVRLGTDYIVHLKPPPLMPDVLDSEHSLSPSERTELNRAKLLDVSIESQKKTMDEYIRWIKDAKEGIHEIETKLLEAASARSRLEASITNLQDTKKRILISAHSNQLQSDLEQAKAALTMLDDASSKVKTEKDGLSTSKAAIQGRIKDMTSMIANLNGGSGGDADVSSGSVDSSDSGGSADESDKSKEASASKEKVE